jgi:hypothetical protein
VAPILSARVIGDWRTGQANKQQQGKRQNTGVIRSAQNDEPFAGGQSFFATDKFSYLYNTCEAVLAG